MIPFLENSQGTYYATKKVLKSLKLNSTSRFRN
jgi:hypothetical protein